MRPMIPKALRLPTDLAEEVTQRARKRGVADADYYRLLIERGLLLEGVELAMQAPVPPAYWGLCEAVLRDPKHPAVDRRSAGARHHSHGPDSGQDEIERMKNHGTK